MLRRDADQRSERGCVLSHPLNQRSQLDSFRARPEDEENFQHKLLLITNSSVIAVMMKERKLSAMILVRALSDIDAFRQQLIYQFICALLAPLSSQMINAIVKIFDWKSHRFGRV